MYRERKIIVSKVLTYSYNEPKQERSKARFNEVLKTAEFILMNKGAYNLTVQDISRLSGMKRPSIYKFFPSNESILEALSIQQARSLQNLIHNNLKNSSKESLLESIKVIIDVYTIYVNNNHPISSLVFNEIAKYYLFENILKELGDAHTGNDNKTRFVLSIINSCLGDFYYSEGAISPKCVSETKKACLLYLSS